MTKKAAIKSNLIINPANRLGEVQEYYFSTKLREIARMRAEGKAVLNLGIGSPDLPPAQEVIDELVEHVTYNDVHGYQSYNGIPELRQAFAAWYKQWFGVSLDPEGEVLPLIQPWHWVQPSMLWQSASSTPSFQLAGP